MVGTEQSQDSSTHYQYRNAIALHLDDQFAFRCGNFFIQMDPDNKEHLFIDYNRHEAIRVTAVPSKKGLGMQILRVPYHKKATF